MLVAVESGWLDFKFEKNVRWSTTELLHEKSVADYLRVIGFIV